MAVGVAGVVSHVALALGAADVVEAAEVHSESTGQRGLDLGVAVRMWLGDVVAERVGKIVANIRRLGSRMMSGGLVDALPLLDQRGSLQVVHLEVDSLDREVVVDFDRLGCRMYLWPALAGSSSY